MDRGQLAGGLRDGETVGLEVGEGEWTEVVFAVFV
eukprot:SAG11_NODE_512_length_8839_cov_5.600572_1_plen_35_part_00